jgi:hypothetical protein
MALKAGSNTPTTRYKEVRSFFRNIKRLSDNASSSMQNGATTTQVRSVLSRLVEAKNRLNEAKLITGIDAFAKIEEEDQTYNFRAEVDATVALIDVAIQEIVTRFPVDSLGFMREAKINADGTEAVDNIAAVPLANLRTALDAIEASITLI